MLNIFGLLMHVFPFVYIRNSQNHISIFRYKHTQIQSSIYLCCAKYTESNHINIAFLFDWNYHECRYIWCDGFRFAVFVFQKNHLNCWSRAHYFITFTCSRQIQFSPSLSLSLSPCLCMFFSFSAKVALYLFVLVTGIHLFGPLLSWRYTIKVTTYIHFTSFYLYNFFLYTYIIIWYAYTLLYTQIYSENTQTYTSFSVWWWFYYWLRDKCVDINKIVQRNICITLEEQHLINRIWTVYIIAINK